MLIKLLGGLDVISALIMFFMSAGVSMPKSFLITLGVIFLIKSATNLFRDFGSWVDVSASLVFFISVIVGVYWIIPLIVGILLVQKGLVSFI